MQATSINDHAHAPTDIRYLNAADVDAAMPDVAERLVLAERAMVALVHDAELPAKIGVHPRPDGSFAHAMPALLRPASGDGPDLLGLKWVTGYASNRSLGLPAINALVILNDASTGRPIAILDGGPITAQRTAAVSGVALRRFGPPTTGGVRVAIVGAGVQGVTHLEVIGHVLPGAELVIHDRHPERAEALARTARATPGIGGATVADHLASASSGADVVMTAASFTTPDRRGTLNEGMLRPDATIIAVDYATMCAASIAETAALFLVDERAQFVANRAAGQFERYPDPSATLGEAILAGTPRPPTGRVLVTHLGVGLADVIFATAILERALALGLGMALR
jgi:ornithine cyclodeaminase/alanine dehydrogenase-like protein (mu-crystallin family)